METKFILHFNFNCGCNWHISVNADPESGEIIKAIDAAVAHAEKEQHTLTIAGEIRVPQNRKGGL